jgi:hypothetical protein
MHLFSGRAIGEKTKAKKQHIFPENNALITSKPIYIMRRVVNGKILAISICYVISDITKIGN